MAFFLQLSLGLVIAMAIAGAVVAEAAQEGEWARVIEDERAIKVETDRLEAVIPKRNPKHWMTGIEKGSFLDKATGFREVGDGLMVIDWLMESGSDEAWSEKDSSGDALLHCAAVTSFARPGVGTGLRRRPGRP